MKTAITLGLWGDLWRKHNKPYDWKEAAKEAAAAGYEGVEIGGGEESLGPAGQVRDYLDSLKLDIAAFFVSVTYNPHPPNTESYQKAMRYAAQLGVKTLSCCGGFMPNARRNTYPSDYDMFAGNFGKAMRHANKYGQQIAFHPHIGSIVETIAETRKMINRLPDFKILIDTAHLEAAGEDTGAFIRAFGKRIIATHIKDFSWKKYSFVEPGKGDGKLDVADSVRQLARAGYDGWLTIELDKRWDKFGDIPQPLDVAVGCRKFLRKCGY